MDRYISVKNVMAVLLKEYEEASIEFVCASSIEAFTQSKAALETIRGVINRVTELLPERKQEEFRKRFFDYYQTAAVKTTLSIIGNDTADAMTKTTKAEE